MVADHLVDASYTLTIKSNVASTFALGTETKKGSEATFTTTSKNVDVKVTADGYIEETVHAHFSDENHTEVVHVIMVKPSTTHMDQASAKGHTVENDDANNTVTHVKAAIEVPSNVTITGNTTDDFSVTVVENAPEIVPVEDETVNHVNKTSVLSLVCTPDGAVFDTPVTLNATIDGGEGLEYEVPGAKAGSLKLVGNKLSFQVDHFSSYDILVDATVTAVSEGEELVYTTSRKVGNGQNTITVTYPIYVGFESTAKDLLAEWLICNFGESKTKVEKTGDVIVENEGSVTINIYQKYHDYTFKSGTVEFKARVYGEVRDEVLSTTSTSSHSGGSGH